MGLTKPRAAQIFNLDYKQSTRVVTTTNITLTGGAPSSVDGVSLTTGDRILVTAQTTGSQNGLYYITTLGSGSNGTWARTSDGNENGEIEAGMIVMVTEGVIYADTQWKLITDDPIVIGTTALTFTQNYMANSISSGTSNVVVTSNANVTISSAGTANVLTVSSTGTVTFGTSSVTGNITGGNVLTGGLISATGNVTGNYIFGNGVSLTGVITSVANINSGTSNVTVVSSGGNVTVGVGGTGNVAVFATTGEYITGLLSATGNITGGNVLTTGLVSSTGNIITAGNISAVGTIYSNGAVNGTGFAVGNSAVSNVGLGFFPTAGRAGDYAIRDYSTVTNSIYFDVGMGGTAAGSFQFRTTNAYTTLATITSTGVNTSLAVSATGSIYGIELWSTQSSGDEGGQLNLTKPATNTTLAGNIIVDVFQNKIRFFENGGTNRGAYLDITATGAGVSTNLLAGAGGVAGSNTQVQFNDGGAFGANGQFVYNKVTNVLTVGSVSANSNGLGTNYAVGDDAYIGDINTADTVGIKGQQNGANAYIVFGNNDSTAKLGRAGSGPLTYAGSFSITGTQTAASTVGGVITGSSSSVTGTQTAASTVGGVITGSSVSVTGNVTGGNIAPTANIVLGNTASISIGSLVITDDTIRSTEHNITIGSLGNIGNVIIGGNLTVNGNTTTINSNVVTTNDLTYNLANNAATSSAANGGGIEVGPVGSPYITWLYTNTSNVWSTGGGISATGNITGGNIAATNHTGTTVSVSGTVTGASHVGSVVSVTGSVTGASVVGGVITGSSTSVTGTTTAASVVGGVITGSSTSVTGTTTAASVVGGVITGSSTSVTGTTTAASVVGGVMTGSSLSVTGTINGTTLTGTGLTVTTGNITGGNLILSGAIQDSGQLDITTTASNGNIVLTPNGTGNVNTGANISVTGRVTAASVVGGVITGSSVSVTGAQTAASTVGGVITGSSTSVTGIVTGASVVGGVMTGSSLSVTGVVTGASVVGGVITGSSASVTGTVTGASLAGTITTAAQTNITSVGTLSSLSVTANVQGGNLRTAGLVSATGNVTAGGFVGTVYTNSIINTGANATGNIGSSTLYFNTAFIKATSAQYADLAEIYVADTFYTPGTIVEFGGNNEITTTTTTHSTRVAGIISTNPAYLMNSTQTDEYAVEVALVGRVPCSVVGTVRKGDRLVSSDRPGVAQALNTNLYQPGCIVGKALEEYDSTNPGVIEVAVGRT